MMNKDVYIIYNPYDREFFPWYFNNNLFLFKLISWIIISIDVVVCSLEWYINSMANETSTLSIRLLMALISYVT